MDKVNTEAKKNENVRRRRKRRNNKKWMEGVLRSKEEKE